jgi:phage terminase large subunit GpA-like protein
LTMLASRHAAPAVSRQAVARAVRLGMESMRAQPPMRLSDWASEHFVLAGESSQQRGGWVAWPFQVGILDGMSDDDIEELDVFKAKRIGYTKMLTASLGFDAAYRRRNQALWQPTDDDRDSYVKTEVDPMIDGVAAVRAAKRSTKGVEDTIKYKQFRSSVLHLLGGKAARAYRRITVAAAKLDEIDAFDQQIEKSADPVTLARGRLEGAPFPKLIVGSTPRLKGASHVEHRALQAVADMRYRITCPHCQAEHPLEWGGKDVLHGFKWDDGDPHTVRHVCPHCRGAIRQADYLRHWVGAWVCDKTGIRYGADQVWRDDSGRPIKPPRHVAMRPWAAYSPQREWVDIVREFLEAKLKAKQGDVGPLQGFVNETLGETWEAKGESADQHELAKRRATHARGTVPRGCLVLVAGVDVQDNRFEVSVWGFGRGEEAWLIDHVELSANPADERDFDKLDAYLQSTFPLVGRRARLGIEAVAVDTGGHFTHQVYNFVRLRERRRVFGIKGSKYDGRPIKGKASKQDVNFRGEVLKRGVKLWEVGTDTAKDLLFGRLKITEPGPGCMHFPGGMSSGVGSYYEQLTNEHRVQLRAAGGSVWRWVKKRPGAAVEALDCAVYALFCAQALDLHRYTKAMWDKLEAAVWPAAGLFDEPDDALASTDDESPEQAAAPHELIRATSTGRISLAGMARFNNNVSGRGGR